MPTDEPSWWTEDLQTCCRFAAVEAFPRETVGLVTQPVRTEGELGTLCQLDILPADATPQRVVAQPEQVVSIVYRLHREARTVLATFHSHPLGQNRFSLLDGSLALWASVHVLAYHCNGSWDFVFGQSTVEARHTRNS